MPVAVLKIREFSARSHCKHHRNQAFCTDPMRCTAEAWSVQSGSTLALSESHCKHRTCLPNCTAKSGLVQAWAVCTGLAQACQVCSGPVVCCSWDSGSCLNIEIEREKAFAYFLSLWLIAVLISADYRGRGGQLVFAPAPATLASRDDSTG